MGARADLTAAIVTRIGVVDAVALGAGTIHDRERYIQNAQPWADAFKGTQNQIRGWWLTWDRLQNEWDADGSAFGVPARHYVVTVWHVTSIDDGPDGIDTYSEHLDRAEALGDDIMARRDFGSAAVIDFGVEVQSIENDTVFLGDYLLWRSAIQIVIPVRLAVPFA